MRSRQRRFGIDPIEPQSSKPSTAVLCRTQALNDPVCQHWEVRELRALLADTGSAKENDVASIARQEEFIR